VTDGFAGGAGTAAGWAFESWTGALLSERVAPRLSLYYCMDGRGASVAFDLYRYKSLEPCLLS
jgi:hypothetical protein